ncbi:hypothetical protein N8993_02145 [Pseudomonadales bacterium]|nr:hypothetical protein [Pseudomonadales bacterium]MDC0996146.1 hypothetical protein [Pseudomonadales bacterium]MDG1002727.1 hypothetical protein [Pseudomonadales bacterium]MDG1834455.1 hypothetical protein [Pseudomonadales bacterium]
MLLRASGDRNNESYNLDSVTSEGIADAGVKNGAFLMELAAAVYAQDVDVLADIRTRGVKLLGERGLAEAMGIASGFNGITKVANGTGLPLDKSTADITGEMRTETGIDEYSEAFKSNKYDAL